MANNNKLLEFMKAKHSNIGGGMMPNYCPQYDWMNLGIICIEEMWEDLSGKDLNGEEIKDYKRPPVMLEFMERFNLTEDEILDGYGKYVSAHKRITGVQRSETVQKAYEDSEFDLVRIEIKWLIEILFAKAAIGAFWYVMRDRTFPGEPIQKFVGYDKLEQLFKISCLEKEPKEVLNEESSC